MTYGTLSDTSTTLHYFSESDFERSSTTHLLGSLDSLRRVAQTRAGQLIVVHRKSHSQPPPAVIAKGVEALDLEHLVGELFSTK